MMVSAMVGGPSNGYSPVLNRSSRRRSGTVHSMRVVDSDLPDPGVDTGRVAFGKRLRM